MKNLWEKLFGISIKNRIMFAINAKIESAQKQHDAAVKMLKESKKESVLNILHEADVKIEEAESKFVQDELASLENNIRNVLSNLI